MASSDDDDLARAWHEFIGRYNQVTTRLDRELGSAHGLTSSEFEVLQILEAAEPDGQLRMSVLAERAHLSQSALSRLVSRLEKDGFVVRTTCADDRRAQWTGITAGGRSRYRAARLLQRSVLREEVGDARSLTETAPRSA